MNEWTNAIRLEIHDLADGRVPDGAIDVPGTTQLEEMTEDNDKVVRKALIKLDVEDRRPVDLDWMRLPAPCFDFFMGGFAWWLIWGHSPLPSLEASTRIPGGD